MNLTSEQLAALPLQLRAEIEENVQRKDFTQSELAAIQREIIEILSQPEFKEQGKRTDLTSTKLLVEVSPPSRYANTTQKVAELFGESEPTTRKRLKVVEAAEQEPELFGDLPERMDQSGSVHGAYQELKHRRAKRERAKQATDAPGSAIIKQQDALSFLSELEDYTVDLLLTDPPYMTDVDDIDAFAGTWIGPALRKVSDAGRAYIFIGAYHQELYAYLGAVKEAIDSTELVMSDVLVWTYRNTLGPSPKLGYKLNWQAILYLHGENAPPLNCPVMLEQFSVQDVNAPDGRMGNRYHSWQKPDELAERFIRHSTRPGALIADPFAGTGTFLLAAARLGRYGIGCDSNPNMVALAIERGCESEA